MYSLQSWEMKRPLNNFFLKDCIYLGRKMANPDDSFVIDQPSILFKKNCKKVFGIEVTKQYKTVRF